MASKSNIVRGMGIAMSIVQELVGRVKKAGGTDEDIHWLTTREADELWGKISNLIIEVRKKAGGIFNIFVDCSRSLPDSIKAGGYDWVNDSITENNFPAGENEKGKQKTEFNLYHFGKNMSSDSVIEKMDDDGYRPATVRELLVFGEVNPELQRQFPIIALGSVWVDPSGYRYVAGLWGRSGERILDLGWFDVGWNDSCRFLAVRK